MYILPLKKLAKGFMLMTTRRTETIFFKSEAP